MLSRDPGLGHWEAALDRLVDRLEPGTSRAALERRGLWPIEAHLDTRNWMLDQLNSIVNPRFHEQLKQALDRIQSAGREETAAHSDPRVTGRRTHEKVTLAQAIDSALDPAPKPRRPPRPIAWRQLTSREALLQSHLEWYTLRTPWRWFALRPVTDGQDLFVYIGDEANHLRSELCVPRRTPVEVRLTAVVNGRPVRGEQATSHRAFRSARASGMPPRNEITKLGAKLSSLVQPDEAAIADATAAFAASGRSLENWAAAAGIPGWTEWIAAWAETASL
jgi:hypothetical protein